MPKIRQEINILNATITATSVGFAVLTTGNYSGTVTYAFEIVGRVTSGTATVTCQRNGTTTNDATISLSSTSYTRLRATLTPPAGATEYRVAISGGTGPQIRAARILVFQDSGSNPITATETQIEIGGQETQTSTTFIPLTAPKYWNYDASKWDDGTSFSVELVGKRDTSTMSNSTWVLQEDNGSFGSWTDKVTIASAITTTTATDYKVAFTPVNGRNYRIVSRDSDTMNGGHVTYGAKIVALQKDMWGQVGNGLSVGAGNEMALAALSSSRVVFFDGILESLRAYDFNGTNWSLVGSGLTISAGRAALAAMSSTRVAFIDETNDQLRAYDFNGSSWSQVGNGLTISGAGTAVALAAMSSTRVAYIDNVNDSLRAYDFDGTNWSLVGSGLAISGFAAGAIASLSSTRIALVDGGNNSLRAYDFNGSSWSLVGSGLSVPFVLLPSMAALSSSRIVLSDGADTSLRTYDFNGSTWSQVLSAFQLAGAGDPSLAALSSVRVAVVDPDLDLLRTYDLGVSVTKLEPQYLLINQNTTTTGLQDYDTLFDPAEWSGVTNAYFHEMNADGASSAVKLQTDPNGTPADISSSTATGANRQRTAALTMPTSSATIDANVITA